MAATKKAKAAAGGKTKKSIVRRRKQATHAVTHEMIQERAYHIAIAGEGGSPLDHWLAAERELLAV